MKYVFDDYGNKFEGLDKEEILQSIGAGGDRECVFTSQVECSGELVDFNYTGMLPDEAIVHKLLMFGINPEANALTEQEVTQYIGLNSFSLNFYQCETEVYVTNATHEKLTVINFGLGKIDVYPRSMDKEYNIVADEKIKTKWLTKEEYDDMPHQEGITYVILNDTEDCDNVTQQINGKLITDIFESNGTTVKKATIAVSATFATNSTQAVRATYASDDTSKGTIEQRLTNLGFEEGVAEYTGVHYEPTVNSLKKQGKYVIFNFEGYFNGENSSITIPSGFRPAVTTSCFCKYEPPSPFTTSYFETTIDTNGVVSDIDGGNVTILNVGWEIE